MSDRIYEATNWMHVIYMYYIVCNTQGRNHGENLGSTSAMVGRICPPSGWDRVKVSENLGATAVAPVAPADTSLNRGHINT